MKQTELMPSNRNKIGERWVMRMTDAKIKNIQQYSETGKNERAFVTCLNMIPYSIAKKLSAKEVAQLVDIIYKSFLNGKKMGVSSMTEK